MNMPSFSARKLVFRCGLVVAAYAVLFQLVARTHMIEKILASSFSWWQILLIIAFVLCRLATYLIVPPTLAALAAYKIAARFCRSVKGCN